MRKRVESCAQDTMQVVVKEDAPVAPSRKCGSKNWAGTARVAGPLEAKSSWWVAFAPSRAVNGREVGPVPAVPDHHKKDRAAPKFCSPFPFSSFNVMGIGIRVSEQDLHCLFRPTGVSRALNDRLEENALSISLFPKPLEARWVNACLDGDTYIAI